MAATGKAVTGGGRLEVGEDSLGWAALGQDWAKCHCEKEAGRDGSAEPKGFVGLEPPKE
jgi:hypothetical protein